MNTNYTYTKEQQQALLHLRDSGSSLQTELQKKLSEVSDKMREAEVIFVKIRFNAVLKQINLDIPRMQGNDDDLRLLSEDQKGLCESLLTQLSEGLKSCTYSSSLRNHGLGETSSKFLMSFLGDRRRAYPKEIMMVKYAWLIRMGRTTSIEDSDVVFEQIQDEIRDRIRREMTRFKYYVVELKMNELQKSLHIQLRREFPTWAEDMRRRKAVRWMRVRDKACLAFCMGLHDRLGSRSVVSTLPSDVMPTLLEIIMCEENPNC
jgi:hypothetical protein